MNALLEKNYSMTKKKRQIQNDEDSVLTLSPEIKCIIRKKVSSYLLCHLQLPFLPTKQGMAVKKPKPLPKEYHDYNSLLEMLKDEKILMYLYKQKMYRNLDECEYLFLKMLCLAIDYECRICEKEIDKESTIIIDGFLFLSSSLLEVGADKSAFYFATIGAQLCEYYKILHPIGQFLLILAKISRKHFKHRQSILMLKKALEYNWWRDTKSSDELNFQFIQWLNTNSPDQLELYLQKFQVSRVFTMEHHSNLKIHKSVFFGREGKDSQMGVYKELFHQFLQAAKLKKESIKYDIVHKRTQESVSQRPVDLQIQIYNQLSFNFLQLNMKEESKIFAQKYESGYIEPLGSKIVSLSCELVHSIQKRLPEWHRIDRKSFQLLFYVDVFKIIHDNRAHMRSMGHQHILHLFKINFQSCFDKFLKKDMFSYQIPLPLEIKRDVHKLKRKMQGRKFIIKQRSISQMTKMPVQSSGYKYSSDKVEENVLLNFRGVGVSHLKLMGIFNRFMELVREKEKQGSFKLINWKKQH